jgi:hypothetical protein
MLRIICDRCETSEDARDRLFADEPHPMRNANAPLGAHVAMPDGWTDVDGKHLCGRCTRALREFMRPLPKAAVV